MIPITEELRHEAGQKARGKFPLFCCLVTLCSLSLISFMLAGCTTKAQARAQAQAAFVAGQQQAIMRMQQSQVPSVTVHGAVRNPLIPWTEDLTVAKAIVAAVYYGAKDPVEIFVVRRGQAFRVDAKQLLHGNDPVLESGDVMEIR
ncbi:MAG: hypothetical protein WCT12_15775 [Verrucomicrobiota bacterium]